jgi:hypothetical protein
MKSQLLCTFTTVSDLPDCITQIHKTYTVDAVSNMRCYQYEEDMSVVCVYNTTNNNTKLQHTITINRKKDTETLYSINALNTLIRELNEGVLDKSYRINWSQYPNQLLLTDREGSFRAIKIKLLQ